MSQTPNPETGKGGAVADARGQLTSLYRLSLLRSSQLFSSGHIFLPKTRFIFIR